MTAVIAAVCLLVVLLCFRFGRRLLMGGLRLILSGVGLALCSLVGIPLGMNLFSLCVVFFLGVPGLLSLIAVYALI